MYPLYFATHNLITKLASNVEINPLTMTLKCGMVSKQGVA